MNPLIAASPRRIIRKYLALPLVAALLFAFTAVAPANAVTAPGAPSIQAAVTLNAFTVDINFAGDQATILGEVLPAVPTTNVPTGTITLLTDTSNTPLDTYPLSPTSDIPSGYVLSTPPLTVGGNYFRAAYSGDANFAPRIIRFSVMAYTGPETQTTLTVSPSATSAVGQSVTLTAHVSALSGPLTHPPVGEISFRVDGVEVAWAYMGANWRVSATIDTLSPGKHVITAEYLDQIGNCSSSTSAGITHTVRSGMAAVRTEFHSSHHGNIPRGQAVTVQAVIASRLANMPTPTGWVQFYDWNTKVGAPVLLVKGRANFKYTGLKLSKHILNAKYLGSALYLPRDTPARTVTVVR